MEFSQRHYFRIPALAALIFVLGTLVPARADIEAGKAAIHAKDYTAAFKELRPEAGKGNADALYMLATMHAAGWGTPKNLDRAHALFGQAAELGHVPAQKEYGVALILSEGVEQNVNEGLKWLLLASQAGHKGAQVYYSQLSKSFPPPVISAARRAAFEWRTEQKKKQEK